MDRPSRGAGGGGGWALRALNGQGCGGLAAPAPLPVCLAGPGALGAPGPPNAAAPPAPLRQDRPVGIPGGFLLQWSYPRR